MTTTLTTKNGKLDGPILKPVELEEGMNFAAIAAEAWKDYVTSPEPSRRDAYGQLYVHAKNRAVDEAARGHDMDCDYCKHDTTDINDPASPCRGCKDHALWTCAPQA